MRLLFVADRIPYPLDRGSHIRMHNLLEACASEFDVTFIAPRAADQATAPLPPSVKSAVIYDPAKPPAFSWRLMLQTLRLQLGFSLGKNLRARMQMVQAIQSLDLDRFDLIFAERPHIGTFFQDNRGRTVVDFDDLEHRKLARRLRTTSSFLAKLHNLYRYIIYRRAEQHSFRDFLSVFVCSKDDQQFLERHGGQNVGILGNGAAIPARPQTLRVRRPGEPLRIVFLGNISYAPNLDAIESFAETVLPIAKPLVASFDVIGPNATPELAQRFAGLVNFRGFVPDLGKALGEYDVMVAPIRFGSGTKLKVLDAMAHGLPVVTTHYGAEGLDLVDGHSALIAETPEDTMLALTRLVMHPELGEKLAVNAFALANEQFSWTRVQKELSQDLRSLVDASRSRAASEPVPAGQVAARPAMP